VGFGHAEAGGEDAGEGEEEASDDGAVVGGDEGGDYGDDAAEEEAGEVFGGLAFAELGDVDTDEHSDLLSQPDGPEGEGDCEPDGGEDAGGYEGAGAVAHEDEADGAGVEEEGEGTADHGAGFECDVGVAVLMRGE